MIHLVPAPSIGPMASLRNTWSKDTRTKVLFFISKKLRRIPSLWKYSLPKKKRNQMRWKIRRTRVAAQQTVKTFMTGFFRTLSVRRLYCIQSLFFFAPMTFGHSAAPADAVKMSWKYAAAAKQQQKLRWTLDQKQRSIFCLHLIRITHFTYERCASTILHLPAAATFFNFTPTGKSERCAFCWMFNVYGF